MMNNSNNMNISGLIVELQIAMVQHGDLKVCTWDGEISGIKMITSCDGVLSSTSCNEIVLELITTNEREIK